MLISDLANSGSNPALENLIRFAGQRQRLIASNIANISTPDYRMRDVSVSAFQANLAEAVQKRRERTGGERGSLEWSENGELRRDENGNLTLHPGTPVGNILFHDRNNRDLERLMQSSAENVGVFRVATDLLKKNADLMRAAITQRA
jgi:flagellar basal-body rod protein FlgB